MYGAGEVIYSQGAECLGLFVVLSGLIGHRRCDEEGHSALIRLCGPGDIIGYRAFLTDSEHRLTAEALLPAQISFIERSHARRILAQESELLGHLLTKAISELTDAEERFFQSVTRPAKARAIHMLLLLYERFGGYTVGEDYVFELPVSRRDLAAMIGIAPESMSRTIRNLEADRLVRFKGRRVCLRNPDRLLREMASLQ